MNEIMMNENIMIENMINGIMINGSPKRNGSASGLLLKELEAMLGNTVSVSSMQIPYSHPAAAARYSGAHWEPSPSELALFSNCRFLVFAFPLYVDGVPSHLLSFLSELEWLLRQKRLFADERPPFIYTLVNCGFYEGKQAVPALRIMENWCARCGFIWGQGIGCGAGPMLVPLQSIPALKGPKKPVGLALAGMAENIGRLTSGTEQLISPAFPRFLYLTAAHHMWRKQGKGNGLSRKDLKS